MNIKDYGYKEEYLNKAKIKDERYIPARIIATYKDRYEIVYDNKKTHARLKKGSFYDREDAVYPTIGDFVLVELNENGDSLIVETLDRESSFSRVAASSDRNHKLHHQHEQVVAANFDYIFIMQSLNEDFNLKRIERYLSLSWASGGAIPVVILTKRDLCENYLDFVQEVENIAFGVDVYAISTKKNEGLEDIKKYFKKGVTIVLLGSSGVGKSTLVNTLMQKEVMKTSATREDDSKGRHTTTTRKLLMLPNGTMIIDTPGMRELGMWDLGQGLDKTFDDVKACLLKCKYKNCTHTNEDGCKILEKIASGELPKERYESYIKLKQEESFNVDKTSYLEEKRNKFKDISKLKRKLKNRN